MADIVTWIQANWLQIVGGIIVIEKILRLVDKLLPANVTVDNDIADILAKLIRAVNPVKKTP